MAPMTQALQNVGQPIQAPTFRNMGPSPQAPGPQSTAQTQTTDWTQYGFDPTKFKNRQQAVQAARNANPERRSTGGSGPLWDAYARAIDAVDKYFGPGAGAGAASGTSGNFGTWNPGTPTGNSSVPDEWASDEDMLKRFGYTGEVGINSFEQQALNFIKQMSQGGGPLATMDPAQSHYGDVLSGAYNPQGDMFRQNVYESTKAGAMQNLEDMKKKTAEQFANQGGYFGGQHALQQALLDKYAANDLAGTLGNLNLEGFNQDLQNKNTAASGLTGMAGQQQGIVGDILNNLMSGGNMLTQREMTNRSEYQNAQQRAYEDWQRARGENMLPFQMVMSLLGQQPFQPVVQQPNASPWGGLLGGLGTGVGTALGGPLGGLIGGGTGKAAGK